MKGRKLLRNLGWIFTIFGILQQLVYFFTSKQFHNSIFDLINTLSIYSGRDSFIWLGLAFLLLGKIKPPVNNSELLISTKDNNELENKKENPDKNIIFMIVATVCLIFLMYYIHDPLMFKDGAWSICFGCIISMLVLGFCIYAYQTLDKYVVKPLLKLLICIVILFCGIYVARICHQELNSPAYLWDHDGEYKLLAVSLIISLIALFFGIRFFWQLIQNKKK